MRVSLESPLAKRRFEGSNTRARAIRSSCRFFLLCVEWSFGLREASVFRDLGDLLAMGYDDAIYPVFDFAGYAIAVA